MIPTDFPSLGSPWLMGGLASLYGRSGMADSAARGQRGDLQRARPAGAAVPGRRADGGLYPLSIVVHGLALNITVQSYIGQLCFGLIACRRAMPDVKDLAAQLERAMQAARALPVPDAAAEAAAPAPIVPVATTATKRRKPRLAVVKTAPVKTPLKATIKTPRATPTRARRRAA